MDSRAPGTLSVGLTRAWGGLLCALLLSLLLHALLLWPTHRIWQLPSWLRGQPDQRVILRLVSPAQSEPQTAHKLSLQAPALAPPAPHTAEPEERALTPQQQPSPELPSDSENGYLPSEFLSRVALPASEIELEDIASPEVPGRLQLLLWINQAGEVTQVDVELTEAPDWFTQEVTQRFKQAVFEPGLRAGRAVASLMRIEVLF
ncbi:hypothetical protein [Rhodoferax sp. U11-2br]|uniref:hypothetical protein n=1 Tax=Rhodoferax sp. U11-2br TaxID=2838878 RepID=UPI001BE71562|nr:hypothetical protein [Rhodoferax sp. U11-2br]MBT3065731.1 hypothetical protein [Rhodoferax sp. U11-2br]